MADSFPKGFVTLEINFNEVVDMAEFIDGYAVSRNMSMAELDCLIAATMNYLHCARAMENFREDLNASNIDSFITSNRKPS